VIVDETLLIQMNEKVSVLGGPYGMNPNANIRIGHCKKF